MQGVEGVFRALFAEQCGKVAHPIELREEPQHRLPPLRLYTIRAASRPEDRSFVIFKDTTAPAQPRTLRNPGAVIHAAGHAPPSLLTRADEDEVNQRLRGGFESHQAVERFVPEASDGNRVHAEGGGCQEKVLSNMPRLQQREPIASFQIFGLDPREYDGERQDHGGLRLGQNRRQERLQHSGARHRPHQFESMVQHGVMIDGRR